LAQVAPEELQHKTLVKEVMAQIPPFACQLVEVQLRTPRSVVVAVVVMDGEPVSMLVLV